MSYVMTPNGWLSAGVSATGWRIVARGTVLSYCVFVACAVYVAWRMMAANLITMVCVLYLLLWPWYRILIYYYY